MNLRYNEFENIIRNTLTESRYLHCLKVAEIAYQLAKSHNFHDPEKARLAGLLHDITKQKDKDFHLSILNEANIDVTNIPYPAYHAYSGVIFLQKEFEIQDVELLRAIRSHTLGNLNMSLLDKIIYIADYLGSDYAQKQPDYNEHFTKVKQNLEYGIYLKSSNTLKDLVFSNKAININTIQLYNQSISELSR